MIKKLLKRIVGSRNDRLVRAMGKTVDKVNGFEPAMQALDDEALRAKTAEFRERVAGGETLEQLLPEAFAAVREGAVRTLGMRHFDVQLIGGIVLHNGNIAEMRTGEGKTLVATLPAYLNSLTGNSVHIVTVNDYLARRDAEWMGVVYSFMGLTTGTVVPGMAPDAKRAAYACDVVYGTNNEFGFDYLRDNMGVGADDRVQSRLSFAIVDEVDSILIDEARTPLIISGPSDDSSNLYVGIDKLVPNLVKQREEDGPGDYSLDEKARQVGLTEEGHQHMEDLLFEAGMLGEGESLYDTANLVMLHHVNAALRAHALFQRDVHYVVANDEVVIVDEFTGRTMAGRRWSEGLHQAVEAKEGVTIQQENQTLASITFQNFFRLYETLSGMTGTADTEAPEFHQIYGLEVVVIPTHREMIRDDAADLVFLTKDEKFDALIEDIKDCQQRGQPVLVGTASIETSEYVSSLLTKLDIQHEVLNAKQHAREADIIVEAGRPGRVTIATNMAGRGTDIKLGGNLEAELEKAAGAAEVDQDTGQAGRDGIESAWRTRHDDVISAGGLHIIGTERHESRRIDNQLRGRSGRQGDPGSSRFYLSLEDDLLRIFASERLSGLMTKLGMQEGEAIEHPWVTKAIENAQRKVENRNFDIRKQLLEYDDVANDQRKEIYALRNELMEVDDVADRVTAMREDVVESTISQYVPPQSLEEQWDIPALREAIPAQFGMDLPVDEWLEADESLHEEPLRARIYDEIADAYEAKSAAIEAALGEGTMRKLEKEVLLSRLDGAWKEHLLSMDYLRQGIGLRAYAQKNPKQEYKREAFAMFEGLTDRIKLDTVEFLSKVRLQAPPDIEAMQERDPLAGAEASHARAAPLGEGEVDEAQTVQTAQTAQAQAATARQARPAPRPQAPAGGVPITRGKKVGRNEPCPCGSGRKFKQCHGRAS